MRGLLRFSPAALRDLERVKEEVLSASCSKEITQNYLQAILKRLEEKAPFPQSGSPLYYQEQFTGY